jgi:hypothetical protein
MMIVLVMISLRRWCSVLGVLGVCLQLLLTSSIVVLPAVQGFYIDAQTSSVGGLGAAESSRVVTCSHSKEFPPGCTPSHCGRHVLDGLFPQEDIDRLHAIAEKGLRLRESVGGPSIIDINTG